MSVNQSFKEQVRNTQKIQVLIKPNSRFQASWIDREGILNSGIFAKCGDEKVIEIHTDKIQTDWSDFFAVQPVVIGYI